MNSYIWLSLETLKEVEITKEGLVIHHHPDMCPYTTATTQKNSHGQTEPHRGGSEEAPDLTSCLLNDKNNDINSCLHLCVGKEQSIGKV